jgi:hypothetical protein
MRLSNGGGKSLYDTHLVYRWSGRRDVLHHMVNSDRPEPAVVISDLPTLGELPRWRADGAVKGQIHRQSGTSDSNLSGGHERRVVGHKAPTEVDQSAYDTLIVEIATVAQGHDRRSQFQGVEGQWPRRRLQSERCTYFLHERQGASLQALVVHELHTVAQERKASVTELGTTRKVVGKGQHAWLGAPKEAYDLLLDMSG